MSEEQAAQLGKAPAAWMAVSALLASQVLQEENTRSPRDWKTRQANHPGGQ